MHKSSYIQLAAVEGLLWGCVHNKPFQSFAGVAPKGQASVQKLLNYFHAQAQLIVPVVSYVQFLRVYINYHTYESK